jgi:uncharacterized membrane protein
VRQQDPLERRAGFVLVLAMVALGLITGLLYSFSVAVMLGLRKTDDRTFVNVMQRINVAIQNPAFGISFVGAFVFTTIAAVMEHRLRARDALRWILAGLGLYVVALAITIGVNIPLNDKLARAGDVDLIADVAALRRSFETPWNVANAARTLAATAALTCLGRALLLHGRGDPTEDR